jgi:nitrate reductase gamma subunit
MSETEFLLWVRGPAFTAATVIMFAGIVVRFMEILLLGRKKNLAEARGSAATGGMSTMFRRSIPDADSFHRSGFTIISGYVFHIGLAIVILFFVPHILLFKDITGLSWPGLPSNVVDAISVVTMIALLAVLAHRLMNPVMRMLSGFSDYLVWFVTILPLITGYLAFHRIGLSAPMMLALHILSIELLMVLIPFTKLSHMFTLWMARWYNGAIAGYKGVRS